ncbi:MAG: ankyrin repeat domain-containing protein [Firmicutes bacterium]|nr:ankyrin repeat domain-containing protein [Bacillota bacterium]
MKRPISKISSMILSFLTLAGTTKAVLKEKVDGAKLSNSRDKKRVESKNGQFGISDRSFGVGLISLIVTSILVGSVIFSDKIVKETEICSELKKYVEELRKKLEQASNYDTAIKNFKKNIESLMKSVVKIKSVYLRYRRQRMVRVLGKILLRLEKFVTDNKSFKKSSIDDLICCINQLVIELEVIFQKESFKEILYYLNSNDIDSWAKDPDYTKYKECKYMHECIKGYETDKLELLDTFGADDIDSNDKTFGGCPPIMLAASQCSIKEFEVLIKKNPNLDRLDKDGYTTLMSMVIMDNIDDFKKLKTMVQILIDNEADLTLKKDNKTALDWAKTRLDIIRRNEGEEKIKEFKEVVDILEQAGRNKIV